MTKYKAYPSYKDSGVEWLGDIPSKWVILNIKRLCFVKRGASPRPIEDPIYFDDYGEYSWVRISDVTSSDMYLEKTTQKLSKLGKSLSVPLEPNDLFLSIAGSVGKPIISNIKCCIHDGFVYFQNYKENLKFLYWVFKSGQPYLGLGKFGTQLNLNKDTVGDIKFGLPPLTEQKAIADFLDKATAKIDTTIEKQTKLIELLKEKRQAVISHAVTKGLNPNVAMKDSGVEWLGDVPEHWLMGRLKNVLKIRNGKDYKHVEVEANGYPVYGSGGIFKLSSEYLYDGESILFGRKGTVDKPIIVKGKFWTVDTMFYTELRINTCIKYIYAQAKLFPFNLLSTSTALPSMTQEDLSELEFIIPPLTEQKQIADYLDKKNSSN
ncbi:restriction endonuclease subunit S [Francisella philomiragia]|uniref:restriction endonuclease subunit S n=1 Tax=Francisella philomiragia TaxID=28110 RepID=UPI001FD51873|nr:restriction endonuclease subunit S [Francisella philomiragia]